MFAQSYQSPQQSYIKEYLNFPKNSAIEQMTKTKENNSQLNDVRITLSFICYQMPNLKCWPTKFQFPYGLNFKHAAVNMKYDGQHVYFVWTFNNTNVYQVDGIYIVQYVNLGSSH